VAIYRNLVTLMKAHFGDDALGRRKAFYFLPWHFSFFHRSASGVHWLPGGVLNV
jgi:tRNA-dihydrouridine synthase 3